MTRTQLVFAAMIVATLMNSMGSYYIGRNSAFAQLAGIAQGMWETKQAGGNDVFTACLIDGWNQAPEFRSEWVEQKACQ